MKKSIRIVISVIMLFSVSCLYADNTGCGLGTALFKGKSGKVLELFAITTNWSTYSQFCAITSGTSGYTEDGMIGINLVEVFVADNMDSLASDIAKGEGEYIDALASLMKVDNKKTFKTKLHKNFYKIYPTKEITSKEVVANIKKIQNS